MAHLPVLRPATPDDEPMVAYLFAALHTQNAALDTRTLPAPGMHLVRAGGSHGIRRTR
jgi:hypothetical protein